MNSRRRTYTAEIPTSLFPEFNVPALLAPCIIGLWDLMIPSELLQDILSRLGLKDNIRASSVCKTWREAAVPFRKLQPRPWLFYPANPTDSQYILSDPSRSQTYKFNFPELKYYRIFSFSRDGWLLVLKFAPWTLFLLNPFTREHIYLPKLPHYSIGYCVPFSELQPYYTSYRIGLSAAPTSTSCLVISFNYTDFKPYIVINTWQPGKTVWTTHRFENQLNLKWAECLFSNGMFYCLSSCSYLGVFDPTRATWNILPVKPCPAFGQVRFGRPMLMTEHEGDIFVILTRDNKNPLVFKLNLNRNVWEEKRDLGGLTVFISLHVTLTRAGLPSEMRNRIYASHDRRHDMYYSFGDETSSLPLSTPFLPYSVVWIDPPHNVKL
ncbi:unnamed protein product [Arabis nemorensis]|uniref:F-box domain-containing protein n=1 Tax=Arabis nemorensis TaxID=586526 RepID=A0A565BFE5_9BRAS|nr:unnamed protein product [Arabis nemorensis]